MTREHDCTYHYFKRSGKWYTSDTGFFPPNPVNEVVNGITRLHIREANGGNMPGLAAGSHAGDYVIVVVPHEDCKAPSGFPRMLQPYDRMEPQS